ncbi:hypothetical protein FOA52_011734 [Chlamydomonas sp. UWO 241]|nr:hypothetical protein FOA52_011734 [Chlamydomonas sp. UWO 241]
MSHLQSDSLGHTLLAAAQLPSTQDFMRAHTAQLGDGTVMVADVQTAGKGRGGNVWTSPDGCLMFSACRKLKVPGVQAPFVNYVISLGLVRGVRDAVAAAAPNLLRPLDVRIKWPNDIYANGLKIGGILIHTTWSVDRFNVVAGIGLNVTNRAPTTCLAQLLEEAAASAGASSSTPHTGEPSTPHTGASTLHTGGASTPHTSGASTLLTRELLLACVLQRLEQAFDTFERSGFGPLEGEYLDAWLHSGQRVVAHDPETAGGSGGGGAAGADGPVGLTIRGLSPGGYLLAVSDAGVSYELTPDGNSLDMMNGLVRRKVQQ